jgi:hypothetical protein
MHEAPIIIIACKSHREYGYSRAIDSKVRAGSGQDLGLHELLSFPIA